MVKLEGDRLVIDGPIVMANVASLRAAGEAYIAQRGVSTLDLSRVTEIDSSALALVLAWQRGAAKVGRVLGVSGAPQGLKTLAELYGVSSFIGTA